MKMAEVAGIAASDDEIELDLGLSIGGRFTKSSEESISRGRDGRTGLSRSRLALSGTSTFDSPSLTLVSDGDDESAIMNSKERCEILVLRRREAKRKREEMQQKRGRDFTCQNEEEERQWRLLKKEKQDELGSRCNVIKNLDLNLSDDQVFDQENYRTNASLPKQVPPEQMLYPYSSFQYVPFVNGYAFPWVIPYWVAGADIKHGNEKIVRHPVACRSFRPFQMNQNITDVDSLNGCKSEQNVSEDGGNWKTGSCESTLCSSSVVSDNYQSSSSHEGGSSSSYTRSNLSNSSSVQHPLTGLNASDDVNNTPSSHHVEPMPNSDNRTHCSEKFVQSHVSTARPAGKSGIKEEFAISTDHEVPSSKTISNTFKSTPITRKNNKMENRKPPKPQTQSCHIPSLLQMPRVSTTGTGQNGKTIVGILHRYSKSEVSILCVCHGESFSPAEFVKHAGGAEVSHPLRHITVLPTDGGLPSAFR